MEKILITLFAGACVFTGCVKLKSFSSSKAESANTLTPYMVYELRYANLQDKCVDVVGAGMWDGTGVQLYSCVNVAAQRFKIMPLDATYVQIVNTNNARCLDAVNGGTEDGTFIQMYACNGSDAQAFRVETFADGTLSLVNKKSNRCLDVSGASSNDGARIQLWTCNQTPAQKIRAVPQIADAMMESYNATYLVRSGHETFYKQSLNVGEFDYFWRQALDVLALQDAQMRSGNIQYRDLNSAILNTFIARAGQDWSWNDFNDDIAWAGLAFARGYLMSGNGEFLNKARYAFDLGFNRGWTEEFGGGLWWDTGRTAKEALSNNPNIILACHLYQFTNDGVYRDKAVRIYSWVRNTLYDANTGAVAQGIKANGERMTETSIYNIGTFIEAANCVKNITGQRNPYYDDAVRSIEYVKNKASPDRAGGPRGSSEFARGAIAFIRDNNLMDTYRPWLESLSRAAWQSRRVDLGIGSNIWTSATNSGADLDAMDAKDGVSMLQAMPL